MTPNVKSAISMYGCHRCRRDDGVVLNYAHVRLGEFYYCVLCCECLNAWSELCFSSDEDRRLLAEIQALELFLTNAKYEEKQSELVGERLRSFYLRRSRVHERWFKMAKDFVENYSDNVGDK